MSDNAFNIVIDSKSETSYASRMSIYFDSHLPSIDHDHVEPEVTPLSNDFDSERASENSPEVLLPDVGM